MRQTFPSLAILPHFGGRFNKEVKKKSFEFVPMSSQEKSDMLHIARNAALIGSVPGVFSCLASGSPIPLAIPFVSGLWPIVGWTADRCKVTRNEIEMPPAEIEAEDRAKADLSKKD